MDDFDWDKVKSIATFLQKEHDATQFTSSKRKVSLSLILGMEKLLKSHCLVVSTRTTDQVAWITHECNQAVGDTLLKLKSCDDLINRDVALIAKSLEPRFEPKIALKDELESILTHDHGHGGNNANEQRVSSYVLAAAFSEEDDGGMENYGSSDEITNVSICKHPR